MKRILTVLILIIFLLPVFADKIDINNMPINAIDTLMIPNEVIKNIKEYVFEHGEFNSVYEFNKIDGVDAEIFDILKRKIAIYPDTTLDRTSMYIVRLQERLASEESPTQGAMDVWEDMLINKMNINNATINDLLLIQGVNITDAVAILDSRKLLGDFSYDNQIRRSPGLTHYSWTRLRNYIAYEDNDDWEFSGYFRTNLDLSNDDTYNYISYTGLRYSILSAINELEIAEPGLTNTRDLLLDAGMSEQDIDYIRSRMVSEWEQLSSMEKDGDISSKLRLRFGNYINAGGVLTKFAGIEEYKYKGYVNFTNLGFIDNIFIGNYRISIGQGLLMDNSDEYRARRFDIIKGLFPDVTQNYNSKLTGLSFNGHISRINFLFFGSNDKRNAVLNPDGSVNMLVLQNTFIKEFSDNLNERLFGGRLSCDLGDIFKLPLSTEIGVSGFRAAYDKDILRDTLVLDIPYDKDNISTPVYIDGFTGNVRDVFSVDFRTNFRNLSFEGEAAMQDDAYAYIMRSDLIFNNFYIKAIFRHYDVGFDNPYARPLSEQSRFDDTSFEKEYRLIDPILTMITDDPRPKPEEGIYLETRFRISEKLTITKAYLDIWKTMDYNLHNYRFQGEIEYRPVFPIRIRLKQKIQEKNIYKSVVSTHSFTNETTLRIFTILSNNNYLNFEMRYGRVNLTTSVKFIEDNIIDGTYVNGSFEHRITDYFSVLGGVATWKTDGMSQWIFEDTGIDFLYGDGFKFYVTMTDRISKNVSIRAKASLKDQDVSMYGIYNPNSEYKYEKGDFLLIRDFTDYKQLFNLSMQLDIRW